VARIAIVIREGLLFGALAGVFGLMIALVAIMTTKNLNGTAFSNFVTSAVTLLIIGGAGRKLGELTKTTTPALQMGALAGGIGEFIPTLVINLAIPYVPGGAFALQHMSAADKAMADDPTKVILSLAFSLALAVLFGAIIGWLGAWSLLQFRPPREPPR
jgi:hypothetical protein